MPADRAPAKDNPFIGKSGAWIVLAKPLQTDVETLSTEQLVYRGDPVIAASGLDFYKGNLSRARKNSLFVGALRGMMLDHLDISGGTAVAEGPLLVDSMSRVRDARIGSNGAANVIADAGKLPKLTPQ